ncbi:hypothetical protein H0E87_005679, partial [Populus deltoides]
AGYGFSRLCERGEGLPCTWSNACAIVVVHSGISFSNGAHCAQYEDAVPRK